MESDKWGDVSVLLILQLDQARGLHLGIASKYILRFQLKYFGLGVNQKRTLKFFFNHSLNKQKFASPVCDEIYIYLFIYMFICDMLGLYL